MFLLYFEPFLVSFLLSLFFTLFLIKIFPKIESFFSINEPNPAVKLRGIGVGILRSVSAPPILFDSSTSPIARLDSTSRSGQSIGVLRRRNKKISRAGGAAIIIAFLAAIFFVGSLEFDNLKWGMVISSILIFFYGFIDDIKNLSWKRQIFAQIIIALIMIYAGLQVDYIANPFGGHEFRMDSLVYILAGHQYYLFSSIIILLLIVGFMNIINWLDGLDGLAGGVGVIGFFTLFFLSISDLVNQPPLGIISIAAAGAILGFLMFNFYPAKIFMGTSGSMFIGFLLAVVSVFSGAKLATLALVLTIPILDAVWVIIRRLKNKSSIFAGDKKNHLHYRLLEFGFSQNKIVFFYYALSIFFGFIALKLGGLGKFIAFIFFTLLVVLFVNFIEKYYLQDKAK